MHACMHHAKKGREEREGMESEKYVQTSRIFFQFPHRKVDGYEKNPCTPDIVANLKAFSKQIKRNQLT